MRLISQDGMIDVPYENLTIAVDNDNNDGKVHILARGIVEYIPIIIAVYSTEAKALKAMEMLRETYLSRMELDGGYDRVNGCYVQPNYWVLPKVFKFPDDSEVEV